MSYSVTTLERWAFTDDLTGLANVRFLRRTVRARQRSGARTVFVAVDLDGFKRAQDKAGRGHAWGDDLLRQFASWLRRNVRVTDAVLARTGGDEFTIVLPSLRAAQAVRGRVGSWRRSGVSASAGVGPTRRKADRALYRRKTRGRATSQAVER